MNLILERMSAWLLRVPSRPDLTNVWSIIAREGWICPDCHSTVRKFGDLCDEAWRMGFGGIPEHSCHDSPFLWSMPARHVAASTAWARLWLSIARKRATALRRVLARRNSA